MGGGSGQFIKELHNSHVAHACSDCNLSKIYIYHEQTYSTCHERRPCLHDGMVMVDTEKYRLVEIRCQIDKDSVSTSNATIISNEWQNAFCI